MLVLQKQCVQEVVWQLNVFLLFESSCNQVIITFKPLIAQLQRSQRVHSRKFSDVRVNQFFNLLDRDSVRHSLLIKEV